jgi:hypothetical protein
VFNQIFNRPRTAFNSSGLRWRHPQRLVGFAKIAIREIECNRSFKVFKFFTECVRETVPKTTIYKHSNESGYFVEQDSRRIFESLRHGKKF